MCTRNAASHHIRQNIFFLKNQYQIATGYFWANADADIREQENSDTRYIG